MGIGDIRVLYVKIWECSSIFFIWAAGLNPILSARGGASTGSPVGIPQLENAMGTGIASAQQAKLIAAQVAQAESVAELNQASAMKARAEAWQTANYAGPEAEARTSSARSVVDLKTIFGL